MGSLSHWEGGQETSFPLSLSILPYLPQTAGLRESAFHSFSLPNNDFCFLGFFLISMESLKLTNRLSFRWDEEREISIQVMNMDGLKFMCYFYYLLYRYDFTGIRRETDL